MKLLQSRTKRNEPTYSDRNTRIRSFLEGHFSGVLATVDRDNKPHATVIYYGVEPSLDITFLTKRGTRKSNNLEHNQHVELVVFDEPSQTTVQVTGAVTKIVEPKEALQVFRNALRASLHTSESAIPPIAQLDAGGYVSYRIVPESVRMAIFTRPNHGSYERLFEEADLPSR